MTRYAILLGSAPENYRQKKIEEMFNFLDSKRNAGDSIVTFANGISELMLEMVLDNSVKQFRHCEPTGEAILSDSERHCEPTDEAISESKEEDCHVAIAPRNDGNSFIPYSVTVCRIEPENNIHVILEAFSKLPEHTLLIVGNWEKSDYGKSLKEKYSAFQNIHLLDPVYEPHTINWLRSNAALYIHGHSAGGTNPSLVEAMNLGLPILAFDCVYNRATTEEKCLYWKNAEELEREVEEMLNQVQHDESLKGEPISSLRAEGKAISLVSEKDCHVADAPRNDGGVAVVPFNANNLRSSAESAGVSLSSKIACDMLEVGKRLYTWKTIAEKYNELY